MASAPGETACPGVVVLGMHRGGTSAVTRTLNLLGLHLGEPGELMVPNPANPTGFWEVSRLKHVNNEVLALAGADAQSIPAAPAGWNAPQELRERARSVFRELHPRTPWVWKDPRTCVTLDFWMDVLEIRPAVVIVQRHPLEIARSLSARDGASQALGLASWERHLRAALTLAAGLPAYVIRYGDLVERPAQEYGRLGAFLATAGLSPADPAPPSEVEAFVDPQLRHAAIAAGGLGTDPGVSESQRELFAIADALAGPHEALAPPALPPETPWTDYVLSERRAARQALVSLRAERKAAVDDLRAARKREAAAARRADVTSERLRALEAEAARLEHELATARRQVAEIEESLSWRLTRPLRSGNP